MEEDASSSMVSSAKKTSIIVETLDSNSCEHNHIFRTIKKRGRHDSNGNVARFKGIVPQHNGHWGAQIYANHQRIWIGTFKTEKEAAMAYDSIAIRLRSTDLHRNFPWTTDRNIQEPNFQNQYSTEAILNMIRDGSYQQNFADFLRKQTPREEIGGSDDGLNGRRVHGDEQFSCIRLFQKELTPSDVGKLNRLVIPKKFAVKYLPYTFKNVEVDGALNAGVEDTELIFYDRLMKSWKFRYCYWRSSQSFVFTKGWIRFVKEKNLKEKDIITFYTCVCPNYKVQEHAQDQHFSLIDIVYYNGQSGKLDGDNQIEDMRRELEVSLRQNINKLQKDGKGLKEEKRLRKVESKNKVKEKELKLFGVRIK